MGRLLRGCTQHPLEASLRWSHLWFTCYLVCVLIHIFSSIVLYTLPGAIVHLHPRQPWVPTPRPRQQTGNAGYLPFRDRYTTPW